MAAQKTKWSASVSTPERLLLKFVVEGNLDRLKSLVENKRFTVQEREDLLNGLFPPNDLTILHYAAISGQESMVRWILSDSGGRAHGFKKITTLESKGSTVLQMAIVVGDLKVCQALVEGCKVENGEREELVNYVDNLGSILHRAVENKDIHFIKWILSDAGRRASGFNQLLARNNKGYTALQFAADLGHLCCVEALVECSTIENGERKEFINDVVEDGCSLLHLAAANGHEHVVQWLLCDSGGRAAGFDLITSRRQKGGTALQLAAFNGHLNCFQAILKGTRVDNGERDEQLHGVDDRGMSVLDAAAGKGHTSIVRWILSDSGGRALGFKNVVPLRHTALHFAAQQGQLQCAQALVEGAMVENGEREALLNAVNDLGHTALHSSTSQGHRAIVEWLLSDSGGRAAGLKSSTITATTTGGLSALHTAACCDSIDFLRALLSGCTTGERLTLFLSIEEDGWSVLHIAAQLGRANFIRELLLHHPETKTIVNHRDRRGMTALHRAVLNGGLDKASRREWTLLKTLDEQERLEVIEALLTFTLIDDDDADEDPQAARLDVNLGIKK